MAGATVLTSALTPSADPFEVAQQIAASQSTEAGVGSQPAPAAPPPVPAVTSEAALVRLLARRLEARTALGIFALNSRDINAPDNGSLAAVTTIPAHEQPVLVFVHGTLSDIAGSFGKLWALHPQRVHALFSHYGGRVYALQHRTLSETPVAAAATLAQALPAGCRIHLLTHDSGGFVAEVLALAAATDGEFISSRMKAMDATDMACLQAAVRGKGLVVERVVRVACPIRGSLLLASGRIDKYLSVLTWGVKLAAVVVKSEILEFLRAVASNADGMRTLPGIAALSPQSALIEWLHAATAIPGELRVVAGAAKGDSVVSWLRTLTTDAFFWTDNDMVVTTRSMYGGVPRLDNASFLLDQGGRVSHFNYFANDRTADAVCSALTQPQPTGFRSIGPLSWVGSDASGIR